MMSIQPWRVVTWSPVVATLDSFCQAVPHMRQLAMTVHPGSEDGLSCGQVLWGTDAANDAIGIAWDWAEVNHGVVAMVDPMTLASNVVLVASDDSRLVSEEQLLEMHWAIHRFDWQTEIATRISGLCEAA